MKEFLANKCPVTAKIDRNDMSASLLARVFALGSVRFTKQRIENPHVGGSNRLRAPQNSQIIQVVDLSHQFVSVLHVALMLQLTYIDFQQLSATLGKSTRHGMQHEESYDL